METISFLKATLSGLISYFITLIDPSIDLFRAFTWIVALDFALGIYLSYKQGVKLSLNKVLRKFGHLALFVFVLFAAIQINPLWNHYGLQSYTVANFIIASYGVWHFFSILQNAGELGFPMASYIQKFIESKSQDIKMINEKKEEVKDEKQG